MRIIKNIALLAIIAAASVGSYLILTKGPCDSPITYRIGQFDPKFGISKADFLADAAEAAKIWEAPFGRQFLKYDPAGELPINLVYDSRQATVDTAKVLLGKVDATESSADAVKGQFEALRAQYQAAEGEYQTLVNEFESELGSYNSEVARWNAQGGAPQSEYQRLEAEKAALESLQKQADAKMLVVNDLARQTNALVDQYNSLVKVANVDVNKINQSADKEFEQGEYISDASGQRINVYEFDGKQKLVRLLAHEMGHALGLDHNSDPESIMYYLNKGSSMQLSAEDSAALKAACRIK